MDKKKTKPTLSKNGNLQLQLVFYQSRLTLKMHEKLTRLDIKALTIKRLKTQNIFFKSCIKYCFATVKMFLNHIFRYDVLLLIISNLFCLKKGSFEGTF